MPKPLCICLPRVSLRSQIFCIGQEDRVCTGTWRGSSVSKMHPGPIIHSFLCMCVVYMFLCLHKCTCVYMEACYKYWVFLNHCWPGSLRLTSEREGTSISGPASQLALGIPWVRLSSFRITVAYHTHSAFTWVLGFERRPSRFEAIALSPEPSSQPSLSPTAIS